jgi:hypothetical protein
VSFDVLFLVDDAAAEGLLVPLTLENLLLDRSSLEKNVIEIHFTLINEDSVSNPPITYYRTVPLILDHSYSVGKLSSSKIADTKVSGF